MRGVVFKGNRVLELMQFGDPTPGPGEAVIEMKASGMCGSDLKFYRSPPGAALAAFGVKDFKALGIDDDAVIAGHEPCGVIAVVGKDVDSRAFRVGDRVMVFHYDGCHYCDQCRTGWSQLCERGARIFGATAHGGHAPYMKVPVSTLLPLPAELSFSAGAAISCGTGTAYGALVRLDVSARDTVAVFGLGPVGQAGVQLAAAMGAEVIAVDISSERVAKAKEFGAAHAIDSSKTDAVEEIRKLTGGKGVTRALDASGSPVARNAAVRATRTWGKVALVGEGGELTVNVSQDMIRKQLTVLGSYTFSNVRQLECARFIAEHGIDADKVFTDRWKLEDAEKAYVDFDKQTGGKAVFEF